MRSKRGHGAERDLLVRRSLRDSMRSSGHHSCFGLGLLHETGEGVALNAWQVSGSVQVGVGQLRHPV